MQHYYYVFSDFICCKTTHLFRNNLQQKHYPKIPKEKKEIHREGNDKRSEGNVSELHDFS